MDRQQRARETPPNLAAGQAFQPGPLTDALPTAVMVVDAEGFIRYANAAMYRLVEAPPGALHGAPMAALVAAMQQDEISALAARVLRGEASQESLCTTYQTTTGRCIEVEAQFSIVGVAGAPHFLTCVHPLGADPVTEAAFQHRQWQLRLFSDLSSDYFYRASLDENQLPIEIWPIERFTAITGYNRADLTAAGGWRRVVHPDDRDSLPIRRELPVMPEPLRLEYRIRTAWGDTRWLREAMQVVEEPDTGARLVFGAVTDVTASRASEMKLRRIFETVSQGFVLLGLDLRVEAANEQMRREFGAVLGRELVMDKPFDQSMPDAWRPFFLEDVKRARAGEQTYRVYHLPESLSHHKWFEFQIFPIIEEGELVGFSLCVDEIQRHKDLEMSLRASDTQLRRIFNTVSQSFALLDRDLVLQAANNKMFYDFERGYSKPLRLGVSFAAQLPPDWREVLERNAVLALQGETRSEELLWHLPNGEHEWARVQLNPIIEEDAVVGLSLCVEGIHRRKMAELALEESERQLRRVYDAVSQGFVVLDYNLVVEAANRQFTVEFEAIFGRPFPLHRPFVEALPEAWRESFLQDAQRALNGQYARREYYWPESCSSAKWFELELTGIVEDGVVTGVILCADEIDRQKRAELALQQAYDAAEDRVRQRTGEFDAAIEQLRKSEERLGLIATHTSDVIWHIDQDNRVLYMSPAFEQTFGWPITMLEEQGIEFVFTPEELERVAAAIDDHIHHWRAQGQLPPSLTLEATYEHKDGYPVPAEINMDFIFRDADRWLAEGEDRDYPHILGVSRDLTERKKQEGEQKVLEQRMLHAQKLESLGVMAGGIAHDFNNLLVGIMGYANLAGMDLEPEHPVREYVEKIEEASLRAAELTQQMLAYAGRGQFVVGPVSLSAMTRDMSHLMAAVISKKAVVSYDLDEALPTVQGDATQLRQVTMNLMTNASEALGDGGGTIRVSTGGVALSREMLDTLQAADASAPGEFVFLEVADSGCGMDAETRDRIFDPFFTTKFTGRGLGLGAVHGIVRGHSGAVFVESEPGAGAIFRIYLPVSGKGLPDTKGIERPVGDPMAGERVLVVDDDTTVAEFAKRTLTLSGYSVQTAKDGAQALEVLATDGPVSAILLDLTMPRLDGAETARALSTRFPGIPIVLSSGHSEHQVAGLLEEFPGLRFLHKPYHPDELRRMVRDAIDGKSRNT